MRQVRKAAVSAQNVVSYTVVVGFANPGSLMLPGMTANVRIITDTRDNVLKVPNAALRVRIAGIEPAAPARSGAAARRLRRSCAARRALRASRAGLRPLRRRRRLWRQLAAAGPGARRAHRRRLRGRTARPQLAAGQRAAGRVPQAA